VGVHKELEDIDLSHYFFPHVQTADPERKNIIILKFTRVAFSIMCGMRSGETLTSFDSEF